MTISPDSAEAAAPRDPALYGRTRRPGPGGWTFAAFGVLCVLSGAAIARFGPGLLPARPPFTTDADEATRQVALADPAHAPVPSTPLQSAPVQVAPEPVSSADFLAVSQRLAALEGAQARLASAATSALTAAALIEASETSRPFAAELTAFEAATPQAGELRGLRSLAESGAPSRQALAASFPDYAARAASASRAPGDDASLLARLAYAVSRVVTLRRVGDIPGKGVDAVLAQAERQIEDGDINSALKTLDGLPPAGREALAPWRTRAERRAEIDRRVIALRARTLEELSRLSRPAG